MNTTQIYSPDHTNNSEIEFNLKVNIYELNVVPNGSIENLYCDILDTIEFSKRINLQNEIMKKIKIGGSVSLKQINMVLLSKKLVKGNITLLEINNLVQNTASILDQDYLDQWISQYSNFKIIKIDIDTLYTYIVMKRII